MAGDGRGAHRYANQLTGALLMYHGTHQNVGTFPSNSERLFQA